MTRARLVVMAGGTASGKSTLARALSESLGDQLLLLQHDRYYINHPDPATADFDHPDSLETSLLVRNLDALLSGRPARLPVYEFAHHRRAAAPEVVSPRPIVLVEGILTLHHAPLAERADLRVYVDAPADVRLARRFVRDLARRGRTPESVRDRYLSMVRPAHDRFVEPSRTCADLVLAGDGTFDVELARLQAAIQALQG